MIRTTKWIPEVTKRLLLLALMNRIDKISNPKDFDLPKLVPIRKATVHDRIGFQTAASIAGTGSESINSRNLTTTRPYRKDRYRVRRINDQQSVNYRLNKNFTNPAIVARNNFSLNAINSFMESAMKTLGQPNVDNHLSNDVLRAIATKILHTIDSPNRTDESVTSAPVAPKYDIEVQKEISAIQVIEIYCSHSSDFDFFPHTISGKKDVLQMSWCRNHKFRRSGSKNAGQNSAK